MNNDLKRTFDTAAELYHRVRPGYPDALFDELVALSGVPEVGSILEVGCGTGQATLPMARRGFRITALDLGANMVAVATRNLAPYPKVRVVQDTFEAYPFSPGSYDLAMSATAFHWVDPAVRYRRAAEALRAGGALAVIGNTHVAGGDDEFWGELTLPAYRRYTTSASDEPMPTVEQVSSRAAAELLDNQFFEAPAVRAHFWQATYDAPGYLDLLDTYSGHISLSHENRAALYRELAEVIDTRFGGRIVKGYLATLCVARKRDRTGAY